MLACVCVIVCLLPFKGKSDDAHSESSDDSQSDPLEMNALLSRALFTLSISCSQRHD